MKGKELELEFLQSQIEDFQRDYETVANDLRVELDGPTQNRLRDRLAGIVMDIDAKEREIRDIQQELSRDAARSSTTLLQSVLRRYPDQLDEMKTAYQNVLRQRSWQQRVAPISIEKLIQELLRIPRGQFAYAAVDEFVANLVDTTQETNLIAELQDWGEQHLEDGWADLLQQVASSRGDRPDADVSETEVEGSVQPALLVQLSRAEEASTQSETDEYYQVKSWVVPDIHQYRANQTGIKPIHVPGMTGEELYALSTLPTELPKLICQFLTESDQWLEDDPELHIFVPLDMINHAIDSWCLEGLGRPQPMGHEYKVVLRCTERLSRSYRQRNRWKRKWTQYQSALQRGASDVFIPADDSDLDKSFYALDEAAADMVGVKVIQAPTCVGADSLFGILLQVGMPLAIWGRENLIQGTNESELSRILNVCCVERLPHTVKDERKRSRKQAKDAHIGHHLSLLWDDPHLIPPKSA